MKIIALILFLLFSLYTLSANEKISKYNVEWNSPSGDCLGSMPLGNGDIGLNAWVEDNGDLLFYISKTDAWSDNGNLLKIGKVRVILSPSPYKEGDLFLQKLNLCDGSIEVTLGKNEDETRLKLWVDANNPVIDVEVESGKKFDASAKIELWRTHPHPLKSISHGYVLFNKTKPNGFVKPLIVEPDVILPKQKDKIGWYHFNSKSVGPKETSQYQGISDIVPDDPLLHRIFGALIHADGGVSLNDSVLLSEKKEKHNFQINVLTLHPSSPSEWQNEIKKQSEHILAIRKEARWEKHAEWWDKFWNKSWINITQQNSEEEGNTSDAYIVSQGYTLQRFVTACAARGKYPIKFNGSIFTVDHKNKPGGPDYRRWGGAYWWQNTRLPYLSVLAEGNPEFMKPLFDFYTGELFDFFKKRTKRYLGVEGAYITEELYIWGAIPMNTYGYEPLYKDREDKLQTSGFHKYEWTSGIELVFMMLDYWDYTQDTIFLKEKLIPVAYEILTFFNEFYGVNEEGEMVIYPSQALETWWNCTNPMPEVSGLKSVTERLLSLSEDLSNEKNRQLWSEINKKLPQMPLRQVDGKIMLAPAERFEDNHNMESPELYAVFPFRQFAFEKPNVEYAVEAMKNQWKILYGGWGQQDLFYSYLGDAENAQRLIIERAKGKDKDVRFPAFWQANFDWVPDQDHGGVLKKAVQSLLIQTDGDKIYLLPAWPKNWNAEFKLHAPKQTTIEGKIENGHVKVLNITPSYRKNDIIIVKD